MLNGDGSSRYRQAEVTAKLTWESASELVLSYTRSRAVGSLNQFDTFLGNYAIPIIRPAVYANLPGDLPNRFLLWGRVKAHFWALQLLPTLEYRNGFPYSTFNAAQDYVGVPNQNRFLNFFSLDSRLSKDITLDSKKTLRLSLSGFNRRLMAAK